MGNKRRGAREDFLEGVAPTHLRAQAHSSPWVRPEPLQSQRRGRVIDQSGQRATGILQEADITAELLPTWHLLGRPRIAFPRNQAGLGDQRTRGGALGDVGLGSCCSHFPL